MLATKKAPAIVLRKAFDITTIHILRLNARQTKPVDEVLGSGRKHAPGPSAVSPQDEMVAVGRKLSCNWRMIFGNRYGAAIFEVGNEPPDIGDVARPLRLLRAVALSVKALASALMACKALDDSGPYLSNGNAPRPQPVQEMTGRAGTGRKGRKAALGVEVLGKQGVGLGCLAMPG
jgi:hypothetical protein